MGVRARTVQPTAGVATLPRPNTSCAYRVGDEQGWGEAPAPHTLTPAYHDPLEETHQPCPIPRIPTHSTRAHTVPRTYTHTRTHQQILSLAPPHRIRHPPPRAQANRPPIPDRPACQPASLPACLTVCLPPTCLLPCLPLPSLRRTAVTMENMNLGQIPAAVP